MHISPGMASNKLKFSFNFWKHNMHLCGVIMCFQLCDDIARLWLPKVEQPANIGTTLSQAEMYRTYFVTSLYDPAKVSSRLLIKKAIARFQ